MYINQYKNYIKSNLFAKPDSKEDAIRFSQMHSWYKHLSRNGNVFYAYLRRGQQHRYAFDPRLDTKNQQDFHWHFVNAYDLSDSYFKVDDDHILTGFTDDLLSFFSRFPIILNNNFGCSGDYANRYVDIERITDQIWNALIIDEKTSRVPKMLTKTCNPNSPQKNALQFVKQYCAEAYAKRDHATILSILKNSNHKLLERFDIHAVTKIANGDWEFYNDLGILTTEVADALTQALKQKQLGLIDIIEAFGDEISVANGARKMMQKVLGDAANRFVYMSDCDFDE